ncbi:MAG: M1 family peptidase, partial [Gemmatimonadota bacterium]|nr:M1 family peptidase [Gemmatimonadota bacterium]
MKSRLTLLAALAVAQPALAQGGPAAYSRADTLRGSVTAPQRTWWDVAFYDLRVAVNPPDSSIRGSNGITYRVLRPAQELQVDLMAPLVIDSIVQDGAHVKFRRDGNAYFAMLTAPQRTGSSKTLTVHYHGKPLPAKRPPWDGGFSWKTDSLGAPWVVTTDQGMGASAWWPNKDTQADEPDSQRVAITVPEPLVNVSNGRLRSVKHHANGTATYEWFATNPINNYAIALAIGKYDHWSELYDGELGKVTLDYWPLAYHMDAAKKQWSQVRSTMQCFEHWFG